MNKFRAGDLIYIPQGLYLYNKEISGFHSIVLKTWYPSLGVYMGKKISSSGYSDINIEGQDFWINPEDMETLNFAR